VPDQGTAAALAGPGVNLGIFAPAAAKSEGINFPITNPLGNALFTRTIRHSGGLTLTGTKTPNHPVVSLTDNWIKLSSRTLSANVSVASDVGSANLGRFDILDLDFSHAPVRLWPAITIGPVRATLTTAAANALNGVFQTGALGDQTVLGDATVKYRRFGD
jgi:hypothetical protein